MSLLAAMFACAAAAHARMPYGAPVAAADLDGDRSDDWATAGASRPDGAGYLFDIRLRMSSAGSGVITVRTPRLPGRLFARDLDGDADRDLVVESFDREPLAVVLNDGGGRFHQADLEEFRARLPKPAPSSFDDRAPESGAPVLAGAPAGQIAGLAPSAAAPRPPEGRAASPHEARIAAARRSTPSTRGPPTTLQ